MTRDDTHGEVCGDAAVECLDGAAAVVAGVAVAAHRSKGVPGKGWRRAFWSAFAGEPSGRLGRVGTRVLAMRHSFFAAMAGELALQPEDDLLAGPSWIS